MNKTQINKLTMQTIFKESLKNKNQNDIKFLQRPSKYISQNKMIITLNQKPLELVYSKNSIYQPKTINVSAVQLTLTNTIYRKLN
jgi:hypothetical protein